MARKGQTSPMMHKHSGILKIHSFFFFVSVSPRTHTHTDHTLFTRHRISRKLDIFPQIVRCSSHKKTHTSLAVTLVLMPQDKAGAESLNQCEQVTEGQPWWGVNCTVTRTTACQALRPVNVSISLISCGHFRFVPRR